MAWHNCTRRLTAPWISSLEPSLSSRYRPIQCPNFPGQSWRSFYGDSNTPSPLSGRDLVSSQQPPSCGTLHTLAQAPPENFASPGSEKQLNDHVLKQARPTEKHCLTPAKQGSLQGAPLQKEAPRNTRSSRQNNEPPQVAHRSTRLIPRPVTGPKGPNPPLKQHQLPADREQWQIQKSALKEKFPSGWRPRKRLSPDALDGIRALHAQDPILYDTPMLAQHFQHSPEAIRRILKSKWRPTEEEQERRRKRWEQRGAVIWSEMAAKGFKAPRKWRTSKHTDTTSPKPKPSKV